MQRIIALFFLFLGFANQSTAAPGDPTIRIFNIYTDEFLSGTPGTNINELVNFQINQLNQALSDSGVHLNVVSVGVKWIPNLPSDYPGFFNAFSQIINNYSVQKARDDFNADVIMALAYSGYTSVVKVVGPQYADEALALVGQGTISDFGYLHEFGHLLGARHQSYGGNPSNFDDTFGVGHGWYERVKLTTTNACKHAIMAYDPIPGLNGVNCTSYRVAKFSNPLFCDDFRGFYSPTGDAYGCLPWGDGTHNNGTVMNSHIPTVANFHTYKQAPRISASLMTIILNALGLQ